MSNVEKHSHDYALERVPEDAKRGFWSLLVVMLGFTFFSASMWAGGSLGTQLTLGNFFIVVFCGNLILGLYTGLLANIAGKTGLSTHLLAHYSYGTSGSYLASFLLAFTQIGWFGVGVAMFALPVQKVTGLNIYLLVILSGALMTCTAYFGFKALTALSFVAVPAITILGLMSVSKATASAGGFGALAALVPENSMPMFLAISACVGSFISGGTLTPDFTRFSKTSKIGVSTTVIAFFLGNTLMFLFGAVGAMATGNSDISEVLFSQGLIVAGIIILGFNIWTTNDNALYASGLGLSNITKLPKDKLVIFIGALGTLAAIWLYNNFVGWLSFLSVAVPSIGAIIITDFYFVKKRKYKEYSEVNHKNIHWAAIVAWVVGFLAAKYLPGIPPINGILAAGISYFIGCKMEKSSEA